MRIFIKMFLIVITAFTVIFCYKFMIISDGIKTVLNYTNLNFNEYDAVKKDEIIADVQRIFTYMLAGRQIYIFETGNYGLLIENIAPNADPATAFTHRGLSKALEQAEDVEEITVPHWSIFAAVAIVVLLFPPLRKRRRQTAEPARNP